MSQHTGLSTVLYARDLDPVGAFYAAVLGLDPAARDGRHVVLRAGDVQLVVLAVPEPLAREIVLADPARPSHRDTDQADDPGGQHRALRDVAGLLGGVVAAARLDLPGRPGLRRARPRGQRLSAPGAGRLTGRSSTATVSRAEAAAVERYTGRVEVDRTTFVQRADSTADFTVGWEHATVRARAKLRLDAGPSASDVQLGVQTWCDGAPFASRRWTRSFVRDLG